MNRAVLPPEYTRLDVDARRPLPIRLTIRAASGAATLVLVATPSDLTAVLDTPLDDVWFDGGATVRSVPRYPEGPRAPYVLDPPPAPRRFRPTMVVFAKKRVAWSSPVLVGRPLPVVDLAGAGLLFELYVARCDLRVASVVRAADVGARIEIGWRDRIRGVAWNQADVEPEEDPHDLLV